MIWETIISPDLWKYIVSEFLVQSLSRKIYEDSEFNFLGILNSTFFWVYYLIFWAKLDFDRLVNHSPPPSILTPTTVIAPWVPRRLLGVELYFNLCLVKRVPVQLLYCFLSVTRVLVLHKCVSPVLCWVFVHHKPAKNVIPAFSGFMGQ